MISVYRVTAVRYVGSKLLQRGKEVVNGCYFCELPVSDLHFRLKKKERQTRERREMRWEKRSIWKFSWWPRIENITEEIARSVDRTVEQMSVSQMV
jgi:hypothetical protein